MRNISILANDAVLARTAIERVYASPIPSRLVVVACPPRLTRHVGRWLGQSGCAQWRQDWAEQLFAQLPLVWAGAPGGSLEVLVASRPLAGVLQDLRRRLGPELQAVDARRHPWGAMPEALTAAAEADSRWAVPAIVASGVGIALALAD